MTCWQFHKCRLPIASMSTVRPQDFTKEMQVLHKGTAHHQTPLDQCISFLGGLLRAKLQAWIIGGDCAHPAWRCLRARMVAGRLGSTGAERFSSRSSVFLERASSALLPGPLPRAPRRSDICSSPCCPPAQAM